MLFKISSLTDKKKKNTLAITNLHGMIWRKKCIEKYFEWFTHELNSANELMPEYNRLTDFRLLISLQTAVAGGRGTVLFLFWYIGVRMSVSRQCYEVLNRNCYESTILDSNIWHYEWNNKSIRKREIH